MTQLVSLLAALSVATAPADQTSGGTRATGAVESRMFATKSLPQPYQVPKRFADGYKLFQETKDILPEALLVQGVVVIGQPQIGLSAKETQGLYANLDRIRG